MLNITDKAVTMDSSKTLATHVMKLNGNAHDTKTDIDNSDGVTDAANPVLMPK